MVVDINVPDCHNRLPSTQTSVLHNGQIFSNSGLDKRTSMPRADIPSTSAKDYYLVLC